MTGAIDLFATMVALGPGDYTLSEVNSNDLQDPLLDQDFPRISELHRRQVRDPEWMQTPKSSSDTPKDDSAKLWSTLVKEPAKEVFLSLSEDPLAPGWSKAEGFTGDFKSFEEMTTPDLKKLKVSLNNLQVNTGKFFKHLDSICY